MEPNANSLQSHCLEINMEVHKVVPPPHRSTFQKLKTRLKETFFPDDPLRQFQGQSFKRKWILGAQYVFPILQWGPNYTLKLFKSDIVAGLTIASLAIPQVLLRPFFLLHFPSHVSQACSLICVYYLIRESAMLSLLISLP